MIRNTSIAVITGLFFTACSGGDQDPDIDVHNDATTDVNSTNGAQFGFDLPVFRDIILVYRVSYTPAVNFLQNPVITFSDGSVTSDIEGVLEHGIEISQQQEPEKWGRWSGSANTDSFQLDLWSAATPVTAVNFADPMAGNVSLDGCYTSTRSFTAPTLELGGTSSTLSFDTLCFQPDGIFSNEVSTSTISPSIVAGSGSSSAGYYENDGHVLRLTYGNGNVSHGIFAIYSLADEPRFGISLNNTVFVLPLPD